MKRKDIYDKFLTGANVEYKGEHCSIDGVKYTKYETRTGIKFLRAQVLDLLKLPLPYKYVDTKKGRVCYIKIRIPASIDGMPVITMVDFLVNIGYESPYPLVCLDLTDSDLSNILDISIFDSDYIKGYVMLPTDDSRRLKPVKMHGMFLGDLRDNTFGHSSKYIDSVLRKIDLSELAYAGRLFCWCDIVEFDFDRYNFRCIEYARHMFLGCRNLEVVRGSINAINGGEKICVDVRGMFKECSKLEHIGNEVFKNIKFSNVMDMFSRCTMLKNLPMNEDNIDADRLRNSSVVSFLDKCKNLNSIEAGRIAASFHNLGINVIDMFDGWEQYVYLGEYECKYSRAAGLARSSMTNIVDASGVRLVGKGGCVVGLFLSDAVLDTYSMTGKLDYMDMLFNMESSNIPKLLIINNTFTIDDIDKRYYEVLDLQGLDVDIVVAKFDAMKLLGLNGRYIVLVDTGIKLAERLIEKGW